MVLGSFCDLWWFCCLMNWKFVINWQIFWMFFKAKTNENVFGSFGNDFWILFHFKSNFNFTNPRKTVEISQKLQILTLMLRKITWIISFDQRGFHFMLHADEHDPSTLFTPLKVFLFSTFNTIHWSPLNPFREGTNFFMKNCSRKQAQHTNNGDQEPWSEIDNETRVRE